MSKIINLLIKVISYIFGYLFINPLLIMLYTTLAVNSINTRYI